MSGGASQTQIDYNDALRRLQSAGVPVPVEIQNWIFRSMAGADRRASAPLSDILRLLALGDAPTADLSPGALEQGAFSSRILALRISKEARIDPAMAITALGKLSNRVDRLSSVQTLRPGDGFDYLHFNLDGAPNQITIDATAGFDPAAELARLARILEDGRQAFYLHRRGPLMLILYLHEESAEALNAAEPGLLKALGAIEVDLPQFRLSRKTLRRLPVVVAAIAAILVLWAWST